MRQRLVLIAIATSMTGAAALAAGGLYAPPGEQVWPQWQARLTVSTTTLTPVTLLADPAAAAHPTLQTGAVFGDYYFDTPGLRLPRSLGGLRATGGLIVGPRGLALGGVASRPTRFGFSVLGGASPLASDPTNEAVPYVGVGYTGLAAKGGWGISADLGLVAENPANAARFGRALLGNGGASWDAALREMRFSPVIQVGVSYAF